MRKFVEIDWRHELDSVRPPVQYDAGHNKLKKERTLLVFIITVVFSFLNKKNHKKKHKYVVCGEPEKIIPRKTFCL